jgi:hypothetical protein
MHRVADCRANSDTHACTVGCSIRNALRVADVGTFGRTHCWADSLTYCGADCDSVGGPVVDSHRRPHDCTICCAKRITNWRTVGGTHCRPNSSAIGRTVGDTHRRPNDCTICRAKRITNWRTVGGTNSVTDSHTIGNTHCIAIECTHRHTDSGANHLGVLCRVHHVGCKLQSVRRQRCHRH